MSSVRACRRCSALMMTVDALVVLAIWLYSTQTHTELADTRSSPDPGTTSQIYRPCTDHVDCLGSALTHFTHHLGTVRTSRDTHKYKTRIVHIFTLKSKILHVE
eukprot:scpid98228/ scgid16517/ 